MRREHQNSLEVRKRGEVYSWDRKGLLFLKGKEGFGIAHILCAELLRRGTGIFIIDCAIRFNVFRVADFFEEIGEDPEFYLHRIIVQRAFTPYQILDSAVQAENRKNENLIHIFLAPFKQFFDGDVKKDEAGFLLKKLIIKYSVIKNKGIPIVIAEKENYPSSLFSEAMSELEKCADMEWQFSAPRNSPDELSEKQSLFQT
ncbi:MAG TPA: hypothetical protein PL048_05935 [Leptospiraceae bacterium]|nr:hypothetical protein [Leptospiraceae bacterium]HMY65920.1 hypothetical protein [Leptospiraceae bacterium]HMZ58293.1 hypothetical protein [Leptospiraceae bacterium]HNF15024.1 hypothetical protein [Leptospiraceae bacterium]HNF25937.1 hypothetical protein [Leptospiraceae bacterium]